MTAERGRMVLWNSGGSEEFCFGAKEIKDCAYNHTGNPWSDWTTSSWAMHQLKSLAASSTNCMWFGTKHILSSSFTQLWRLVTVPQMMKLGRECLSWAILSWLHGVSPRRACCNAVCNRVVLLRLILFLWGKKTTNTGVVENLGVGGENVHAKERCNFITGHFIYIFF